MIYCPWNIESIDERSELPIHFGEFYFKNLKLQRVNLQILARKGYVAINSKFISPDRNVAHLHILSAFVIAARKGGLNNSGLCYWTPFDCGNKLFNLTGLCYVQHWNLPIHRFATTTKEANRCSKPNTSCRTTTLRNRKRGIEGQAKGVKGHDVKISEIFQLVNPSLENNAESKRTS